MITVADVANIIVRDCGVFGVSVYQEGNIPPGAVNEERIIVRAKRISTEVYWNKGFVEVNLCVPNRHEEANLVRLEELGRMALQTLESCGELNGEYYRYSVHSHSMEVDNSMECHYINARLLFEVLNVN